MRKLFHLLNWYLFQYPFYKLSLGNLGSRSKLMHTKVDGHKRIYIGSGVYINDGGWLACLPLTGNNNCSLTIGDGTYVGRFCHFYATSKIEIGKKVLMADKVYIADNLHQYENVNMPVIDQPVKQAAQVVIGDGAWLGENVCVIGASVGKQSVVGANSVVMKDIPDYCVAVGAPARIIKRYSFEKSKWLKTNENGEFIN
ncbi:MAG: acyltransferase [Bacteroidetes bacterium]|nr:acyltransferase [Bacteroidota bacterium]